MLNLPEAVTLPLKTDDNGLIRVSGTRVTLDTIIARYQQGDRPEDIHEGFETVPLTDIYAVIAYYLAHQTEVDAYLEANHQEAERLRQEWETRHPPKTKSEWLAQYQRKRHQDK